MFPKYCLGCKKHGVSICNECLDNVVPAKQCPEPYMRACFSYKDPVINSLIRKIKFRHQFELSEGIVRPLSDLVMEICEEILGKFEICLVPIPSNSMRVWKRGFDQSLLIASKISVRTSIPLIKVLERSTNSKKLSPQSSLSRRGRLANMSGAFEIKNEYLIKGKFVILVDDVITTGSTVQEARKLLVAAGAKKVFAVALAH